MTSNQPTTPAAPASAAMGPTRTHADVHDGFAAAHERVTAYLVGAGAPLKSRLEERHNLDVLAYQTLSRLRRESQHGQPVAALAYSLDLTLDAARSLLTELEEEGLIGREAHADEGRADEGHAQHVFLTADGVRRIEQLERHVDHYMELQLRLTSPKASHERGRLAAALEAVALLVREHRLSM